jgi:uncharacterized membrane protein
MYDLSKYKELKYFVYYVIGSVILSLILLIVKQISIIRTLQACFGIAYVVFLPGYFFVLLLFDKKEIDIIERLALSFALSIAIVTLTIIFTNTVIKIPITPINNFLIIMFVIVFIVLLKILKSNIKRYKKS